MLAYYKEQHKNNVICAVHRLTHYENSAIAFASNRNR